MRALALLVLCSCSAVVSPDPELLGGGDFDAGPGSDVPNVDAGPGNDSGAFDAGAGQDAGPPPPVDGGPGCEDRPPRCDDGAYVTCVGGSDVRQPCPSDSTCDVDFGGCRPVDECPGSPPVCRDGSSFQCTGAPVYTQISCDRGCDAETGLCNDGFVPSNLGADVFLDDADDVTLPDGDFTLNTSVCMLMRGTSSMRPMNDGRTACVWQVRDLQTSGSTFLRVVGALPLIIMASGDVSLQGTIDLSANGSQPGPGGFLGGSREQPNGSGASGGLPGASGDPYDDGGGGGAGGLTAGGRGGDVDGVEGGEGGAPLAATGEPLFGGSGGGIGPGAAGLEGEGGAGGGAIQISALGSINLQGTIHAGGGGGGGGLSRTTTRNRGAGGGGGAGGTILLEAPRVEMQGRLSVSGGGGGSGPTNFAHGEDGEDGPIDGQARGGDEETEGGDGGGETPGAGASTNSSSNGGGGGGSAGTVVLRGEDVVVAGDFNPDVSPVLRTL